MSQAKVPSSENLPFTYSESGTERRSKERRQYKRSQVIKIFDFFHNKSFFHSKSFRMKVMKRFKEGLKLMKFCLPQSHQSHRQFQGKEEILEILPFQVNCTLNHYNQCENFKLFRCKSIICLHHNESKGIN